MSLSTLEICAPNSLDLNLEVLSPFQPPPTCGVCSAPNFARQAVAVEARSFPKPQHISEKIDKALGFKGLLGRKGWRVQGLQVRGLQDSSIGSGVWMYNIGVAWFGVWGLGSKFWGMFWGLVLLVEQGWQGTLPRSSSA